MRALTPAQEEVLDTLRARGRTRPVYEPGLRDELRAALESSLPAEVGALDQPLVLTKATLARVLSCEAHEVAEAAAPFAWTPATARGTVAHKAIELSVHRRDEPSPLDLVDAALARLEDDPDAPLAGFLLRLGENERAELRSLVNDQVSAFLELWPPLSPRWVPRTESRVRAELCGGRVVLAGKVDLTLGAPDGMQAGRLVVDLKTGASHTGHLDDLRFYALLDTLRVGVPPFRLASYYLDAGRAMAEDVTLDTLDAAVRRTVAAATKVVELRLGLRSPAITPNHACRWCCAKAVCDGATQWRESAEKRFEADR